MTDDLTTREFMNRLLVEAISLDIECPFHIHIMDSDQMGINKIPEIIKDEQGLVPVIGVGSARIRQKIAVEHQLPINTFSFITENGSDLLNSITEDRHLILWNYLDLPNDIGNKIAQRDWARIDMFILLKQIISPTGEQNFTISSLLMP